MNVLVDPNIFVNLKLLRFETEKVKSKLWPCSGCIALRQGQSTFKSFLCEKRMINLLKIITCFKMVYDQFCHFKTIYLPFLPKAHLKGLTFIENGKPCIM